MNQPMSNKQSLETKISELEETLAQLKKQLQKETEAEQHAAIDNLDVYFEAVNNKFKNLQDFWPILRDELKALFATKPSNR
jgi:uncharacterized coiled-coil protein SlyX